MSLLKLNEKEKPLIVIVEPYLSTIIDQQNSFKSLNIRSEIFTSQRNWKEKKEIIESIKKNNFSFEIILTTPESILNNFSFKCCLIHNPRVNLVVFDEIDVLFESSNLFYIFLIL